jgi:hypothetical protein
LGEFLCLQKRVTLEEEPAVGRSARTLLGEAISMVFFMTLTAFAATIRLV